MLKKKGKRKKKTDVHKQRRALQVALLALGAEASHPNHRMHLHTRALSTEPLRSTHLSTGLCIASA
eukprot:1732457-Rhodomonas_salina.1